MYTMYTVHCTVYNVYINTINFDDLVRHISKLGKSVICY